MARPKIETKSIVIDSDGKLIVWTDGMLSGDNETIKTVRFNASMNLPTPLTAFGPVVDADLSDVNNMAGALAAMLSANQGRSRILEAPDELLDLLPIYNETTEYTGEDAEGETE